MQIKNWRIANFRGITDGHLDLGTMVASFAAQFREREPEVAAKVDVLFPQLGCSGSGAWPPRTYRTTWAGTAIWTLLPSQLPGVPGGHLGRTPCLTHSGHTPLLGQVGYTPPCCEPDEIKTKPSIGEWNETFGNHHIILQRIFLQF